MIQRVIETLKSLDVRGFDSMDRLVGLVMLFEKMLKQLDEQSVEKGEEDGR